MSQYQEKSTITKFEQLSEDNIRLTLHAPLIAESARAGQFVMIQTGAGKDPLLRRPFSLHQTSSNGQIQIYFKNVGRGTDILAHSRVDEVLDVFARSGVVSRSTMINRHVWLAGGSGLPHCFFWPNVSAAAARTTAGT